MPTKGYNTVFAVPKESYARYSGMKEGPFSAVKTIKVDQFNLNTGERQWTNYHRQDDNSKYHPQKRTPKNNNPPTPPNPPHANESLITDDGWDGFHPGGEHYYTTTHDNPWGSPPTTSITQHDYDSNITTSDPRSSTERENNSNDTYDHWWPPVQRGQSRENLLPIFVAPSPTNDEGVQVVIPDTQGTQTEGLRNTPINTTTRPTQTELTRLRSHGLGTQTELYPQLHGLATQTDSPPQLLNQATQSVIPIISRATQAAAAANNVSSRGIQTMLRPGTSNQQTQAEQTRAVLRNQAIQSTFSTPMLTRPTQTNPRHGTNRAMQVISTQTSQLIPPPAPPNTPIDLPQAAAPARPPGRHQQTTSPTAVAERSRSILDYSTRQEREHDSQVEYKPYHRFGRPPIRAAVRAPIRLPPLTEETHSYTDTRDTLIDSSAPYGIDANLVDDDLQFLPMLDITPDSTIDYNDFRPVLSSTPIPDITPDEDHSNVQNASRQSQNVDVNYERNIPCVYCEFTTHSRAIMGEHLETMHPRDANTGAVNRVIPCQYCSFTTHSRAAMGAHIQQMHVPERTITSNTSATSQTGRPPPQLPPQSINTTDNVPPPPPPPPPSAPPATMPCVYCPFPSSSRGWGPMLNSIIVKNIHASIAVLLHLML